MPDHLDKEILQGQRADFQRSGLFRRVVKDIGSYKAANRILTDYVYILGSCFHVFLQPADTKRLCFNRLQRVKKPDASLIDDE